jgi:hypothetical protein
VCAILDERCKLIGLLGKRLLKNLVGDGQTMIENFRQVLKKLRDDFISDVIVSVETNVFRILAAVESIRKDITEVKGNVKEVGA